MENGIDLDDYLDDFSQVSQGIDEKLMNFGTRHGLEKEMLSVQQLVRSVEYSMYLYYGIEKMEGFPEEPEYFGLVPGDLYSHFLSLRKEESKPVIQSISKHLDLSENFLSEEFLSTKTQSRSFSEELEEIKNNISSLVEVVKNSPRNQLDKNAQNFLDLRNSFPNDPNFRMSGSLF